MHLSNQVTADPAEFMKTISGYPKDKPVTMINILKFKDKSGRGEESGMDAYKRYSTNVAPLTKKVGAQVVWAGKVNKTLVGDTTDQPHMVLLVRYPTFQAFLDMALSEEYKAVSGDRTIALEYGGLLVSSDIEGMLE